MFRRLQSFISALVLTSFVFSMTVTGRETVSFAQSVLGQTDSTPTLQKDYGKMPLLFEENRGQTDKKVKFISRIGGYTAYLTEREAVFSLKVESPAKDEENGLKIRKTRKNTKSDILRMSFVGANPNPTVSGEAEAVTKTNYYIGQKRFENVPNYRRVNYKNLYNGIDAVFYGNSSNSLEYDFTVAPNVDPAQIALEFEGAQNLSIDEIGQLVIKTPNTELIQQKPFAYQIIDGEKREVAVNYKFEEQSKIQNPKSKIGFALGDYDRSQPLVIDPALDYLTYIGGTLRDDTFEIAADDDGNAYVSGETESLDFHGENRNDRDESGAYVAKINANGTAFVYITILEGNGPDLGTGLAVNSAREVYFVGQATRDFPTTSGAFDTNFGASADGFAAKLGVSGNLIYSTFIGGSSAIDLANDVAIDSAGKAYIVGETLSGLTFPQKNRYQGCGAGLTFNSYDAYLTVLNAAGSDITYSTCIGGNVTTDQAFSVALDSSNNVYMTGIARGGNFPTKNAFQSESGGSDDAFVAKFNPASSGEASLIFSTYLGGRGGESGKGIAVNSSGQPVVVGITGSIDFPLANAFRSTNQINEGFVTVLNANGTSLVGSSFLGGSDQDDAFNVAVGNNGLIYVVGNTLSSDFPMALPFQANRAGGRDAYFAKIKFGVGVLSSSFIGGSGNDEAQGIAVKGNFIYVNGITRSTNLPTTGGVIKATSNASTGNTDGFVAKILDTRLDSVGVFRPATTFLLTQSTINIIGQTATLTSQLSGQRGVAGDWNNDGIDTIGSFTNGVWKIRNANFPIVVLPPPFGATTITFGVAGDLPVAGDWNNDGIDTPGVFRPSTGQFFLTNSLLANPPIDAVFNFGTNGDLPIAGDWNGDGFDTVGVYRPSQTTVFLTNNIQTATIDFQGLFGIAEDLPTAGDWNGDGLDSIGQFRPSTAQFFLSNDNVTIANTFIFGQTGDQPIAGDWDGQPLP